MIVMPLLARDENFGLEEKYCTLFVRTINIWDTLEDC